MKVRVNRPLMLNGKHIEKGTILTMSQGEAEELKWAVSVVADTDAAEAGSEADATTEEEPAKTEADASHKSHAHTSHKKGH